MHSTMWWYVVFKISLFKCSIIGLPGFMKFYNSLYNCQKWGLKFEIFRKKTDDWQSNTKKIDLSKQKDMILEIDSSSSKYDE